METKKNFKKLFLNENLEPIIQNNSDGVIIIYSTNKEEIRYELTYHYLFGKLISISQKDLKGKNNKKYSIISLLTKMFESLFMYDKFYYVDYKQEENILLELYNRALIY